MFLVDGAEVLPVALPALGPAGLDPAPVRAELGPALVADVDAREQALLGLGEALLGHSTLTQAQCAHRPPSGGGLSGPASWLFPLNGRGVYEL